MGWNSEFPPGTDPVDIAILECLRELKAGGINATGGKHINVLDGYCDPKTGKPVLIVVTTICADDGTSTTTTETIPVANQELNVASNAGEFPKEFTAEIRNLFLPVADMATGTQQDVIDAAVAAGLPDLVCKVTGDTLTATPDMICAGKVRRLPCGFKYLTDPADPASQETVGGTEETTCMFAGGLSVNADTDSELGGFDPAAPVVGGDGTTNDAIGVWCLTLRSVMTQPAYKQAVAAGEITVKSKG